MPQFLVCNIFISIIICILLFAKQLLKNNLTSRMQYNLWFLLLGLLAVPFIPTHSVSIFRFTSWFNSIKGSSSHMGIALNETTQPSANISNWMNDFSLSISNRTTDTAELILCGAWSAGVSAMILLVMRSWHRLVTIKRSALPLQNQEVYKLYDRCLSEAHITRHIPIYSTAFLKSPIITGFFKPRIYLPIHLISDYNPTDMRYMLLHELQHYKHNDAAANHLMNIAGILYWFNPFVWYALKEMRNDREVACDTSVLKLLKEEDYEDYGNTLINFAEKVSLSPFPFASGISGNMKQLKRRIINIVSYKKPSGWKISKGIAAFGIITIFLLFLAPALSTYAADGNRYQWNSSAENISLVDLSTYFSGYDGSFVLYDKENNSWNIYNMAQATLRSAPNSTYKIYDALFGLEEGIITPMNSFLPWNNETYPFEAWNTDQTLSSAMQSSVNWYFQTIDEQLGDSSINAYIQKIGYGNENVNGDLSSYWLESSLKISPVEQVQLLQSLHSNKFGFAPENIQAVKESMCLSSSSKESIYGKTGTGRINGQDINGWFIGYIETAEHTYFFATNIKADANAAGSRAAEITLSILSDLQLVHSNIG